VRQLLGVSGVVGSFSMAAASSFGFGWSKRVPVLDSMMESSAPPALRAMTGRPQAWDSTAVIPKSSICGWRRA